MKLMMTGSGSYKSGLTYVRAVPLGQSLKRGGWEVALVVPSADKYNGFIADKKAKIDSIKLFQPWQLQTKTTFINLLPYMWSSLITILKYRPEMIYMFKPSPANITALIARLWLRVPLVVDFDDLGSEVMRQQGQPGFQVWLVGLCERLALRKADAVTVTSNYLYDSVKKQFPDKPVLILSNGVDPEIFKRCIKQSPRKAIYYFGALNRLSLIESFLRSLPEIIKRVPDTMVTIIGGGSSLNDAKKLVKQLGIAGSVEFTGWIQPEAIYKYIKFADIAVCTQPDNPTVRAASNLKVFQYMAVGSVPVVSRVGDLPNYVGPAEDGMAVGEVVDPCDESELSDKLVELLNDPKRRAEVAIKARSRAEQTYSWDKLGEKLDSFLSAQLDDPLKSIAYEETSHV